jgi:hypothetical protein
MTTNKSVSLRVAAADALSYKADVLALKYAQALYGVDGDVYLRLWGEQPNLPLPKLGEFVIHNSHCSLGAAEVMFLGVQPLDRFGYAEIREFGRKVLELLAVEKPEVGSLALTIQGPGYGLDEVEAFESELAGVIEAISAGAFPPALEVITFVEIDLGRAKRLSAALGRLLPDGKLEVDGRGALGSLEDVAQSTLRSAGYSSASKPRVFVAMPFASEMDDTFHYGIQGAANAAGLLCERADLSTFTGDIMMWVKHRISTATLVVADLSSANPNVYLEVGYAWGCNVATILLAKDPSDLKFNVSGHRHIIYKSIKQLEESLARELKMLLGGNIALSPKDSGRVASRRPASS